MGFYIESSDRPYTSAVVNEDIDVGELGADNGSDKAVAFDQQSHGEAELLGVATAPRSGEQIRADDDATDGFTYKSADNDRASFGGDEDRAVIKVKTIEDNGDDGAPSITDGDVVGVVDSSAVSGSAGEFQGRLVEEGYEDATPTTFNRSNGNFFALGIAHRDDASSFDEPVRVQVRKDLN